MFTTEQLRKKNIKKLTKILTTNRTLRFSNSTVETKIKCHRNSSFIYVLCFPTFVANMKHFQKKKKTVQLTQRFLRSFSGSFFLRCRKKKRYKLRIEYDLQSVDRSAPGFGRVPASGLNAKIKRTKKTNKLITINASQISLGTGNDRPGAYFQTLTVLAGAFAPKTDQQSYSYCKLHCFPLLFVNMSCV